MSANDTNETPTWRQRRIDLLTEKILAGEYWVPDLEIAAAILYGRPRWGDNPQIHVRESRIGGSQVAVSVQM